MRHLSLRDRKPRPDTPGMAKGRVPYGNVRARCAWPCAFSDTRFSGMERPRALRNRWYSPQLGQFMSHDPLEYIDSYDLYAFAKLDPINFWDPWGLSGGSLVPNYVSGGSVMEGTSKYLSASPTNFVSFDSGMFIDHSVGSSSNSPPAANSGTSAQRPQPSRPGSNRNRKRSIAQRPGLPSNALACGGRLQLECSTFVNQGGGWS